MLKITFVTLQLYEYLIPSQKVKANNGYAWNF